MNRVIKILEVELYHRTVHCNELHGILLEKGVDESIRKLVPNRIKELDETIEQIKKAIKTLKKGVKNDK